MLSSDRLTGALRSHKKALIYTGTALALAGAGSASAATVGGSSTAAPAVAAARATSHQVQTDAAHRAPAARRGAPARKGAPAHRSSPARHNAPANRHSTGHANARRKAAHRNATPSHRRITKWYQVLDVLNAQTNPVAARQHQLPKADQLTPVGTSGPQAWMPMTGARLQNAATIVREAIDKRMGLRSAVIAVATAMQESGLLNLNYGTSDSLGLFQQRPSCGWGTAAQVTDPAYASGAFLKALRVHQANDPTWARQPLWANAQAVQNSGFPYAYAKWETQAAHLVAQMATKIVQARA